MEKQGENISVTMLENVVQLEDIARKKTQIYARLLIEPSVAKQMEELSLRHEKRQETLLQLLGREPLKKAKEGGRVALNVEGKA